MAITLIDIAFAKTITGIEDEAILEWYLKATIKKIEKIIGYSLEETTRIDYINGVNTKNVWLIRKPVTAINEVKINDEITDSSDYSLRNAENKPHLHFDYWISETCEVSIDSTAGFTAYNGLNPLDQDIEMFIYGLVNQFSSSINTGNLKSYKIDAISYSYTSWLDKSDQFKSGITDLFGLSL